MPLNSQWPRIRECSTSSCHLFFRELDAFYSLFDDLYFYVSIQWTSINRSQASAFLATPIDDGELHERKSNGTGSNHLRKSVVCMGSGRSLVTNRYPPYHVLLTAHALIFNFSRPSKLLWNNGRYLNKQAPITVRRIANRTLIHDLIAQSGFTAPPTTPPTRK